MLKEGEIVVCLYHIKPIIVNYCIPILVPIKISRITYTNNIIFYHFNEDEKVRYSEKYHKFVTLQEYRKLKLLQLNND